MKKTITALALVSALMLLLSGCSGKTEETGVPAGMKLASGEQADYLLYVPEEWRVDKNTLYTSAFYSAEDATSISVTAYGMKFTDSTVEDWWKTYSVELAKVFDEISDENAEKAQLGGIEGMRYTYGAKLAEKDYRFNCTAVIKDNYVYYLLYTSTLEHYEQHLTELDKVVANFSFK